MREVIIYVSYYIFLTDLLQDDSSSESYSKRPASTYEYNEDEVEVRRLTKLFSHYREQELE